MDRRADVAVVGGGVVGLSIAYALARRERTVAVIDAGALGQGTSDNSFAWINATSKAQDEPYHRLNARGAAGYRALCAEWGEGRVGVHPAGMLEWAAGADTARVRALRERLERLRGWGYPASLVGEADLRAMEPHVQFPPAAEGLYAMADGWLDVPVHVAFLRGRLEAHGARLIEDTPARELILGPEGQVLGVGWEGGGIAARRVVVAAGRWTPQVLGTLTGFEGYRTRFPMQTASGLLVRTPPLAPFQLARHILYTPAEGHLHLRPTPDGGLVLGADDVDGQVGEESEAGALRAAAAELLERAREVLPRFAGGTLLEQCQLKVGIRPMPSDGRSIVGALPGAPGLFVAVTHSGITLGPAIGELLAQSVASDHPAAAELEPFAFDRFQSPKPSRSPAGG